MRVVVIGAGICGLGAGLLLARDGHEVTLLERDPVSPPEDVAGTWESWPRKGIAQFRQPHFLLPGLRLLLGQDLPDVLDALVTAGAVRLDMLDPLPPPLRGLPRQPEDGRFWTYTCRRPAAEWAFRKAAERQPGLEIRCGVRVAGLIAGPPVRSATPHVTGVRTEQGEAIAADLVIDAGGRGSRAAEWLAALGAPPLHEEAADCNFTYSTRYFRGNRPEPLGPLVTELGSISILTLPAEDDSWSVTLFASSADRELRALRDADAWTRVVAACPMHAHWLDGEPISDILAMSGVVDRYRAFLADGAPVATGFVAVADAWACTNPSAGRGLTVGMKHVLLLRDTLRALADDPWAFALHFHEETERALTPWFRAQIAIDRARFGEMEADRGHAVAPVPDALVDDLRLLVSAMAGDPDIYRLALEFLAALAPLQEIMARPGVRERLEGAAAQGGPPGRFPAPSRTELVALVRG